MPLDIIICIPIRFLSKPYQIKKFVHIISRLIIKNMLLSQRCFF